jgi:hypothetical protein
MINFERTLSSDCKEINKLKINRILKDEMTWDNNLDYNRKVKVKDFKGCPFIIQQEYSNLMYFRDHLKEVEKGAFSQEIISRLSRTEQLDGFAVDIAKILAKFANFTPHYRVENNYKSEGFFLPTIHIFNYHRQFIDPSLLRTSFYFDMPMILVTKLETIGTIEILHGSFDILTWTACLASLGAASVVVFYINLRLGTIRIRPKKDLSKSALNVIQILFGCQQKILSQANFARFLLILFIGLCLELRICYWSRLTGFMTTGLERSEPKSIEDLIEQNYTIYACQLGEILETFDEW